ncbi:type VI secretion system tube protein TssD [Hymenobacter terrenus]|uniref:type VI secretion system tube protein TssD n=1 Tax=Hymenobacter terrenus TaxID=1629124 RepID=UPI0006975846|nr:type VI secretion system tube protein TssD [Hymenobacter terrenus]
MGAIYAELHVAGHVYPLISCTYGVHQGTNDRGRAIERVRYGKLELVMDVPNDDFIEALAAAPATHYPAHVTFLDSAGGRAIETVNLAIAYCTRYEEEFEEGENGRYVAYVELTGPGGFTMSVGGPAAAFVAPPARDHGVPPVAVALTAARPFVVGPDGVPRLPRITADPPFEVKGATKHKPALDRGEYVRQLTGQQHGLNRLTVAEFLANRDAYMQRKETKPDGRDPKGNKAQEVARKIALRKKIDELQVQNPNLTRKEVRTQADQWLDTQTALHDPDQIAGGHGHLITGVGDARVNYAIGGAWPKRIKGIDRQIRAYAAAMTPEERATTYLDIVLPVL